MNLFEYQAKEMLRENGIAVPRGGVADTAETAGEVASEVGGEHWVVKAQILAGARGQGSFKGDDLKSGIQSATNLTNVISHSRGMLGRALRTPLTGPEGLVVNKVYIEHQLPVERELSLSILVDEFSQSIVLLLSGEGGTAIESHVRANPDALFHIPVSIDSGPDTGLLKNAIDSFELDSGVEKNFYNLVDKAIELFVKADLSLLEINPIGVVAGECIALDAKISADDNALYRQELLQTFDDSESAEDNLRRASRDGFNYIRMDGDIACMTVGAGLSMATLDTLVQAGGRPANFLDLPPDSKVNRVTSAIELLLQERGVRCLLINVFGGGIMRCDTVSDAIQLINNIRPVKIPMVVRLAGTNAELANRRLRESMPGVVLAENMARAAQMSVQIARQELKPEPQRNTDGWLRRLVNRVGGPGEH